MKPPQSGWAHQVHPLPSIGYALLCFTLAMAPLSNAGAKDWIVSSASEANDAVRSADPGDVVIWKNGTYSDQEIDIHGNGTAANPITLRAEEPTKVILTGSSSLNMAGEYLIVDGLRFEDGEISSSSVVETRSRDDDHAAYHSRITNCTVKNYSGEGKYLQLYGTNNRLDHSHLGVKEDREAMLVVRFRDLKEGEIPAHRIDHNLFSEFKNGPGDHPNGYETIRIGLGDYLDFRGDVLVENNVFVDCDGEIETISNKTSYNTFRGNTFIRCRGQLSLRHGFGCIVDGNYFFGGEKEGTSGVRVIGEDHQITNN
ncbi:MAG: polysaccharide lyase 6 family protein, partial [Verrucomicrobiota bacterium]